MKSAKLAAVLFGGILAWTACSFDYSTGDLSEVLAPDVPDTILIHFTHVIVRDGRPVFRVEAERAETYETAQEIRMTTVLFEELDEEGTVITRGRADNGILNTETENVELTGTIDFYSERQQARLLADYLYWNKEERSLVSLPGSLVVLTKDSGTTIQGRGFSADFRRNIVLFDSEVQGSYVVEEEEAPAPETPESVAGENAAIPVPLESAGEENAAAGSAVETVEDGAAPDAAAEDVDIIPAGGALIPAGSGESHAE